MQGAEYVVGVVPVEPMGTGLPRDGAAAGLQGRIEEHLEVFDPQVKGTADNAQHDAQLVVAGGIEQTGNAQRTFGGRVQYFLADAHLPGMGVDGPHGYAQRPAASKQGKAFVGCALAHRVMGIRVARPRGGCERGQDDQARDTSEAQGMSPSDSGEGPPRVSPSLSERDRRVSPRRTGSQLEFRVRTLRRDLTPDCPAHSPGQSFGAGGAGATEVTAPPAPGAPAIRPDESRRCRGNGLAAHV